MSNESRRVLERADSPQSRLAQERAGAISSTRFLLRVSPVLPLVLSLSLGHTFNNFTVNIFGNVLEQ